MTTPHQPRSVIVGGATARTGPAVLRAFLQANFQVTATTRQRARLEAILGELPTGETVQIVEADLLKPADSERVVTQAVERFGRVDAMTTLAQAGFLQKPFAETTLEDLQRVVVGGLYTTYTLCRAVVPQMLRQGGGYIATVAGGSALDPAYGRALFGAAKAAVVTLTKGIARDHKQDGIRANCLVAGTIATEEARRYLNDEELREAASLEEFADALVFLCSPQASGLSGAIVELNGREID